MAGDININACMASVHAAVAIAIGDLPKEVVVRRLLISLEDSAISTIVVVKTQGQIYSDSRMMSLLEFSEMNAETNPAEYQIRAMFHELRNLAKVVNDGTR